MEKAKKRTFTRDQAIRKKFQSKTLPNSSSTANSSGNGSAGMAFSPLKLSIFPLSHPLDHRLTCVEPGTVMAMHPQRPVILGLNETVVAVSRAMAGNKTDAALIVNEAQELAGIVTDKDLAFRCVSEGLDAKRTLVSTVMSPYLFSSSASYPDIFLTFIRNPKNIQANASLDEAINVMMSGHFRHLPVVDENQKIVGLLDITKVMQHVQAKIDNSWGKAHALRTAFTEFQQSWQNFAGNQQVEDWFEDWSSRTTEPLLCSVIEEGSALSGIPQVTFKTNVREAVRVMKQCKSTAVLVMDEQEKVLGGIFTTKDVCLRVLAPSDLDPATTSVVRVMTPHPDCATDEMKIRDALRKMHDGHYLHLPVLSHKTNEVVGLVDVLSLTYQTIDLLLKQQSMTPTSMQNLTASSLQNEPVLNWSQFWGNDEVNDSTSLDDQSRRFSLSSAGVRDNQSDVSSVKNEVQDSGFFTFKFRNPFTGTIYKFNYTISALNEMLLMDIMEFMLNKCGYSFLMTKQDAFATYKNVHKVMARDVTDGSIEMAFRLSYKDDENDYIFVSSNEELLEAVSHAKSLGWNRLILLIEVQDDQPGASLIVPDISSHNLKLADIEDSVHDGASSILDELLLNEHDNKEKKKFDSGALFEDKQSLYLSVAAGSVAIIAVGILAVFARMGRS